MITAASTQGTEKPPTLCNLQQERWKNAGIAFTYLIHAQFPVGARLPTPFLHGTIAPKGHADEILATAPAAQQSCLALTAQLLNKTPVNGLTEEILDLTTTPPQAGCRQSFHVGALPVFGGGLFPV